MAPVGLTAAAVTTEVVELLGLELVAVAVGADVVEMVPLDAPPGAAVGWQSPPVPVRMEFR
jgi:hypothetical protein